MMIIDNKFEIGQEVYLKTDREQFKRIVTGISVRPAGIVYLLSRDTNENAHYEFEITETADIMLTTTG